MNLKKKYNDLVNELLIKRTLYYEAANLTSIKKNSIIYKNRYYYYAGMIHILEIEARILGITLEYCAPELANLSWRDICPKG